MGNSGSESIRGRGPEVKAAGRQARGPAGLWEGWGPGLQRALHPQITAAAGCGLGPKHTPGFCFLKRN